MVISCNARTTETLESDLEYLGLLELLPDVRQSS